MDADLKWILAFVAAVIGFALAWHIVVKNFVVASLLSGICVFITMGILNRDFEEPSLFSVVFHFFAYGVTTMIFSLAIGIPFNRRRNPLPLRINRQAWNPCAPGINASPGNRWFPLLSSS